LTGSFQLNNIKFYSFHSFELLNFTSYFASLCGHNLRVHLSIQYPHYTESSLSVECLLNFRYLLLPCTVCSVSVDMMGMLNNMKQGKTSLLSSSFSEQGNIPIQWLVYFNVKHDNLDKWLGISWYWPKALRRYVLFWSRCTVTRWF